MQPAALSEEVYDRLYITGGTGSRGGVLGLCLAQEKQHSILEGRVQVYSSSLSTGLFMLASPQRAIQFYSLVMDVLLRRVLVPDATCVACLDFG